MRVVRLSALNPVELFVSFNGFWNETLVKVTGARNPQLVSCRGVPLGLYESNTLFLVRLGETAARGLFDRDFAVLVTDFWRAQIVCPYNSRGIAYGSRGSNEWRHLILARTRASARTDPIASTIHAVAKGKLVFNMTTMCMPVGATHDADLAGTNSLLLVPHISVFPVLHFTLAPGQCAGPATAAAPFKDDVLEALLEPIEAHDNDGTVDEDGRAQASHEIHCDLCFVSRISQGSLSH